MTDYRALLHELAVPRLVGTANHQTVRAILTRELVGRGFLIDEHPFLAKPSAALCGAPKLVRGVNVIARRPSAHPPIRPSVWLVAHYDSKGQPISMATRLVGAGAATLGLAGSLVAAVIGATPWPWLIAFGAGAAILLQNRVTDHSPGAVDNATALIAVFMTIDRIARPDVGVVFADAEELGLLGARALARERPELLRGASVINLDGIDDRGPTRLIVHRRGPVGRAVAAQLGVRRTWWMPVVVDGLALRGAAECVTIVKGDWRTARLVHTPGDVAARLTLAGAEVVAGGVARALAHP